MAKDIFDLKEDVSKMTGIEEQELSAIEFQAAYFLQVINSNINVKQFSIDETMNFVDLPDDLYYCALVPMVADYYTAARDKMQNAIDTIKEGDSSISFDVDAMTKATSRNYSPIYSKYRKLVTI